MKMVGTIEVLMGYQGERSESEIGAGNGFRFNREERIWNSAEDGVH